MHGFFAGLHAVAQGVFHEWLKNELRNERREKRRIDFVGDGEFGFETLLHKFQVAARDLQFLFERQFVRLGAAKG